MSLFTASELAEDRTEFLTLCSDTVRITRAARTTDPGYTPPVFNEDTGQYDEPARVTVYEGPGRLQVKVDINSNVVESTGGERDGIYLTEQLQLPTSAPTHHARYVTGDPAEVDVNNICVLLASPHQPGLVGVTVNVAGPFRKSQATYLRFRVKDPVA